jgi:hypothetical protein
MRLELPPDAVEHVAKQVGVAASELGFYDFTSRAAKRHRSELRELTGWHECTKTDLVKLVSHLVDVTGTTNAARNRCGPSCCCRCAWT